MKLKRLLSLLLALGFVAALGGGPLAAPAQASSLKVCGQVTAYVKPTAVATGALTIHGVTFTVGIGATLPAGVAVGADLCADLTTNGLGLVTGAAITANAHVHVHVCGDITAYVAATATSTGLLKVGSQTFTLGLGTTLPASVHAGANLCLDLTLDGFGRVSGGSVSANVSSALSVCGTVTAYVAATATSTGSITVAGHSLVIAIGASLPASVHVGANLCLDLTLNGFGQVSGGSAIVNVTSTLKICGTVTAYVAATATSTGLITVAGHALVIAMGAVLPASVHVGADLCLNLTLNGFGQVSGGTAIVNVTSTLKICGTVTAYTAATATSTGSLTLAGHSPLVVAIGTTMPASVRVGADLCLTLTLNAFGQVSGCGAIVNVTATLDVCGQVTAYVAATATNDGHLTVGQTGWSIASAAVIDSEVTASAFLKLHLTLDAFARIAHATVVKVGVSVDDACGSLPAPSSGPGASSEPGSSPGPGSSPEPGSSTEPGSSPEPGQSEAPGASPGPGGNGEGDQTSCTTGSGSGHGAGSGSGSDSLLPSTNELGGAGGIIATNAIPLIAMGLLGGLAAWYRSRRNGRAPLDPDPTLVTEPELDGQAGALS